MYKRAVTSFTLKPCNAMFSYVDMLIEVIFLLFATLDTFQCA